MVEFLFLGMIRHLYYSDPLRLAPLRTMELRLLELVSEASSWDFSAALKFGIFDKSFIPRILPEKFAGNPHLQQEVAFYKSSESLYLGKRTLSALL
ncbi:uncharacterized protein [Euphorbia lathyris]|uniref:uncharacterized protein isoform X1 n=1 Tax=Euphorbia lathyris TaxID=212925 RepID=UPI0033132B1B